MANDKPANILEKQKEIALLQKEQVLLIKELDRIFHILRTSLNLSTKDSEWINSVSITSINDLYDVVSDNKDDYVLKILNDRSSLKEDKDKILSKLADVTSRIKSKKIDILLDKVKQLEDNID